MSASVDSRFVSADELEARRQCARWLLAILDADVSFDDDYFAFLGWICGGMDKLAKRLSIKIILPKGRTKEAMRARAAMEEVSLAHPMRLDDHLSDLYRENPCLQKQIRNMILEEVQAAAAEQFTLQDMPFLGRLEILFGLNEHELELCYLAFILSQYRIAERFLEDGLEIHSFAKRHLLGALLGMNGADVYSMLKDLENMGIVHLRNGGLRLTDNVESALLAADGKQVQNLFCKPAPESRVSLEKFYLDKEDVRHALRLMGRNCSDPAHLLLYGAPGCGKSSFAASLIRKLGVNGWMVPCGEKDDVQNRRASLAACLRLASTHPGAIVVVDEAERILDTHTSGLREGSPKAWVNDLLERESTRVIWITNQISHLDGAVRRRFSYSIRFAAPGRVARKDMWASVARDMHLSRRLTPALREHLAANYEVPIATMELALRQAKSFGAGVKLRPVLDRILKAQVTLRNDGVPPRLSDPGKQNFDPNGIAMENPVEKFIAQAKKMAEKLERMNEPGLGNMLFYGPPGTGKTALARYLADELDRELIARKASDILGPYVGMTEQNIASVFNDAEQKQALLLIDEADTFLYSRASAQRSWEQSMTNEFLTALESFRGICICTTNFRDNLDNAAIRRFPVKVKFSYARPEQLEALYRKLLAPLAKGEPGREILQTLMRQKHLAPGDFAAVRLRMWMEDELTHEYLLDELLKEQRHKLDEESKTMGF